MKQKIAGILVLLEKVFLIIFTLGIVIYFIISFNIWASDLRDFFSRMGNIEMYIYLSLFLFILSYVFRKLLLWEVNILLPHRRRRR